MKNALLMVMIAAPFLSSCGLDKEVAKIEKKAILINKYENVALKLAKENRELRAHVKRLEFDIQKLKQANGFKGASVGHDNSLNGINGDSHAETPKHGSVATHGGGHGTPAVSVTPARAIASIQAAPLEVKKDLVEYKTYKWSADDMMKIADKEFKAKNFEKAAQFYTSLVNYYPDYKGLDDEFYFKAGISAYESGEHHEWTIKHFGTLMQKWPTSQYYRSAKLWVALTHMKMGQKDKFFATVEEFRKKYRNTNEWKILSSYYEKIEEKTHE